MQGGGAKGYRGGTKSGRTGTWPPRLHDKVLCLRGTSHDKGTDIQEPSYLTQEKWKKKGANVPISLVFI